MIKTLEARTVDVRFMGAGNRRSLPDADRGCHGSNAEDLSRTYQWHACGCRPSASTPPSSSRSRTSCVTTPGTASRHTSRWENSNRGAGKPEMYWELARLRQAMNQVRATSSATGKEAVPGLALCD